MNRSTISNSSSSSCYDIDVYCNYSVLINSCFDYEHIAGITENLFDTTYFLESKKYNIDYFYNISYIDTNSLINHVEPLKLESTSIYELSYERIVNKKNFEILEGDTLYILYHFVKKNIEIIQIFTDLDIAKEFTEINRIQDFEQLFIVGLKKNKMYKTCYEYEYLYIFQY